ncbi:MAG: TraR/DksA C4-type zinc finger protein [Maricaulaceae bacterium]
MSEGAAEDRKPVELDQQSVGRLSRLDSMQVQAMAKAAEARRAGEIKRIDAALARLDAGEYGWCVTCGEAISADRLSIDPAAPQCAACAQ